MNVLYYTYPTAFNLFGGGEIQLLKTKEWIEKTQKNCHVKLFDIFSDKLDQYDILHNFTMNGDCLSLCKMAKSKGIKIAISPIYYSSKPVAQGYLGFDEKLKSYTKDLLSHLKFFYENLAMYRYPTFKAMNPSKQFLDLADIILPNSEMEASLLSSRFRIDPEKFHVVHNAADERFSLATPEFFRRKYGIDNFILFVGRIERVKNVLSLVRACKSIGAQLVVIGSASPAPGANEYFKAFQEAVNADPNIHYLGFLSPNSEEVLSAYAAAKVFVLPSQFETAGLAALEAGLAGCNIVITERGYAREYFKDLAWYVDPTSTEDIRAKILTALNEKKTTNLREMILENYTWKKAAEQTFDAYSTIAP
ncbi:glycosyltransferase [Candidatus Bathyarchaeota archaeon]|nr:glycosyltransferase [Candidatus Bathyarchaeota archaeon]